MNAEDFRRKFFLESNFYRIMPDEFDFKNYKSMEDFEKTAEGTKYLHSLYLKAVNHPIRREILDCVNKAQKISRDQLLQYLLDNKIIENEQTFNFNIDYLIKALCIKKTIKENTVHYEITQSGQVVDYLK